MKERNTVVIITLGHLRKRLLRIIFEEETEGSWLEFLEHCNRYAWYLSGREWGFPVDPSAELNEDLLEVARMVMLGRYGRNIDPEDFYKFISKPE